MVYRFSLFEHFLSPFFVVYYSLDENVVAFLKKYFHYSTIEYGISFFLTLR